MRLARKAVARACWPLQPLRSRRLYLRGALLGAFFSVFATVTLASGGIVPAAVIAPDAPSAGTTPVAQQIVVPEIPVQAEPPYVSTRPITPGAEFVRDILSGRAPFVPSGSLTEETIAAYALLAGWHPSLIDEVLDVAWCESRYNPLALNGYMRGLMQVNTLWFDYSSTNRDHWEDPLVNLRVAHSVYQYDLARGNQPWAQWECKPGGHVLAASADSVPVSSLAPADPTATPEEEAPGGGQPEGDATPVAPAPTPAPWDLKPSWPPKYDRGSDAPTPTPWSNAPGGQPAP